MKQAEGEMKSSTHAQTARLIVWHRNAKGVIRNKKAFFVKNKIEK